ncbi:MAG: hypothetical protein J5764_02510 [Bacteroidales bacterium]|nr:hypothetical protein [Bacteroidales bacterium]MBO4446980.1 hypothetical protein [Bacteroidales bacterium]
MIKKKILVCAVLAQCLLPSFLSCTKDGGVSEENGADVVLNLAVPSGIESRTWLESDASSAVLPVWWSDGDRVCVNSVTSSALSVSDGQKLAKAAFNVRNVAAPFRVFYPAEFAGEFDESGNIAISVPASQEFVDGSFAKGAAMLYGYSASEDGEVSLKNLCGAACITLKDSDGTDVISSLSITSIGGEPIAGQFSLNPETGALSAVSGTATISMTLPEGGVALGPEGRKFIFTVPAGSYPGGFSIRFTDARKHVLRCFWLRPSAGAAAGLNIGAGSIAFFDTQEYVPDAREIISAEDWQEFAAALNSGGDWQSEWLSKAGTVDIMADFETASLAKLDSFDAVLDGHGHTLTQTAGNSPLIGTLTGAVKNLRLAGKNVAADPANAGAAVFVSTLAGEGLVENCINDCSLDGAGTTKTVGAAIVRTMNGGSVVNCVNNGDLHLSIDVNTGDRAFTAAGIVATCIPQAPCLISGCTNNGNLSLVVIKAAGTAASAANMGYGGIVGTVLGGDAENFLTVDGCANTGKVSLAYSAAPTNSKATLSGVGGIVGAVIKYNSDNKLPWYSPSSRPSPADIDCYYIAVRNCTNSGDVSNDMVSTCSSDDCYKAFAGGIAGILNGKKAQHIAVENCVNTGKVIPHEQKYSRSALCSVAGGLCGFASYADFTGCTVNSPQVGTSKRQVYAVSAGIGYAISTFKIADCKFYATLYALRTERYTPGNYSLGFSLSTQQNTDGGIYPGLLRIQGTEVTGSGFGGVFNLNANLFAYNSSSTPKLDLEETVTASTYENYIYSPSFATDYDKKGYVSMVSLSGNYYWDGK